MWVKMLLYPTHTLPTALAPVAVAAGLACHDGVFDAAALLLALVAGWFIQVGGVFTDNYENLVRHPNDREHPQLVQALRTGALTLTGLRAAIAACYSVALLAGVLLATKGGIAVVVIGLLSIAASWIYSAGPFTFGEHGLADPLFFTFFGIVSVTGSYYVQAAPALANGTLPFWQFLPAALPLNAVLAGLPVGALATAILLIDDIRDCEFDVVKGKRTVATMFGKKWSRVEYIALAAFAYAAPLFLWLGRGYRVWILLPWLTLPFAVRIARDVLRFDRFLELAPMTPRAAALQLGYAVLLSIGAAQGRS
jgi:1,4-dihydroxy-2-naphthoate octaprenyltransferase